MGSVTGACARQARAQRPGDGEGTCDVHNPRYDFNDEILPVGASYFARLIELTLPKDR